MVRPSGRIGDDDLGPATDRTGRVEGRTVTASSRGVRGHDSTSDLPATLTYLALGFHHGTSKPRSSAQPLAIPFRSRPPLQPHLSHTPVPYEPYGSALPSSHPTNTVEGDDVGDEEQPVHVASVAHSRGSDGRPHQGKGKELIGSFMSVISLAEGGLVDPELIPSFGGYVAGPILRGQDRGSLKFRSCYMALTGWELTDAHVRVDISVLSHVCTPVRPGTEAYKPYIQQFPVLGYKNENKLLDIHLRLDVMTADELYMLDRVLRQFGYRQCIPTHPIQSQEACRPPNNMLYVLRNTFVEALWLETSVLAIPPSSCTDDYMGWYFSQSHSRIQNPGNIPRGFHLPVAPVMPPQALLDLIAREATREDLEDSEFRRTVRDLLRKHYRAP
ncbi:hypothetical protein M9H77_12691 [Catharanthus roseus]|uniref:Uncharacterized protein n=1 Tax=Catharanthus roseus TaxID=4058 RepID=A0ACC0BIA9_CATRO|nr:hypothetical protein M9H77_12691 [Catharanthus roseus]